MLTHLPEAPTFTSGFAGAWARVAASGKVLIYKADSGLVWRARWPIGLRCFWPEEMRACGSWWGGGEVQAETWEAKQRGFYKLPFSPPLSFSSHNLSRFLWRSPDENSTNQLRINRDSDNTTSNSPFTATGATRGPTQHHSSTELIVLCVRTRVCMCAFEKLSLHLSWRMLEWNCCLEYFQHQFSPTLFVSLKVVAM